MFPFSGLGTPEIISIMLLALLVFGPKKLPEVGRSVGKAIREFRKNSQEIADSFKVDVDMEPTSNSQNEYVSQYGSYYGTGYDGNEAGGGDFSQTASPEEAKATQPAPDSDRTNSYRAIARGRSSKGSASRRRV